MVKPYNPSVLSPENFERILRKFPHITNLSLNGFGEPLLNRDIIRLIRLAKRGRPYLRVFFHTNGEFLTPELSRELVESGLTRISLSIDAAEQEAYEKIRLGGKWKRLQAGLHNIVEAKRSVGSALPIICASYSVMAENYGQLPQFVEMVARAGVDMIGPVRFVSSKWGYRPVIYREGIMEEIARAREVLARSSLEPIQFPVPEDVDRWIEGEFRDEFGGDEYGCRARWSLDPVVHLSVDGSLLLCCERPYPEEVNLGNFLHQPFREVWNSPQVQRARHQFYHRHQPHSACEGCGWLTPEDMVLLSEPATSSPAKSAGTFAIPDPPHWVRARQKAKRVRVRSGCQESG